MPSFWPYMVFYGRVSSFLVVIDPNSFGLVLINSEKNIMNHSTSLTGSANSQRRDSVNNLLLSEEPPIGLLFGQKSEL